MSCLVHPQPILNDISTYSNLLEQAKKVGGALIGDANQAEKQKIEARIRALEEQFESLQQAAQTRMTGLEDAMGKATTYENQSDEFDRWMRKMEKKMGGRDPFPIASQPLEREMQLIKVCTHTCTCTYMHMFCVHAYLHVCTCT